MRVVLVIVFVVLITVVLFVLSRRRSRMRLLAMFRRDSLRSFMHLRRL